jgi:hypothetical protein
MARADLGVPFRVYALALDDLAACAQGAVAEAPLEPTTLWQFPVHCEGSPRTLLTVDFHEGAWRAVDLGGLSPAHEMDDMRLHRPDHEGYTVRYVRVFAIGCQWLTATRDGVTEWIPLESTGRALRLIGPEDSFGYESFTAQEAAAAMLPHAEAARAADSE